MTGVKTNRQVLRVLLVEGLANATVLVLKIVVGLSTHSVAILADALHSLTDVANNVIAFVVIRASGRPADREHPYGHQKFEMLAVFVLAVLLASIGLEISTRALGTGREAGLAPGPGLAVRRDAGPPGRAVTIPRGVFLRESEGGRRGVPPWPGSYHSCA